MTQFTPILKLYIQCKIIEEEENYKLSFVTKNLSIHDDMIIKYSKQQSKKWKGE